MSEVVLKIENVGKQYRLGQVGTGTLSHDINRWWHKVRGKEDPFLKVGEANDHSTKGKSDYVWALKNIDFEVKRGDVLGIVGKNGAGKSTLLKILSQVASPTIGEVKVRGRIASLLEVGTGFHPELTGHENIFLNGAILGMTKAEIKSKFEEIVDFSGVERYIDTPVKRYSSGMYVRLAFAVAAHLEPEILIVDEVLAVGDAEFQKKCLGKMKDVSGQGRTVLFVSHNMTAVKSLCTTGLFLKNGTVEFKGDIQNTIDHYFASSPKTLIAGIIPEDFERYNTGEIKITEIALFNKKGDAIEEVYYKSEIKIKIKLKAFKSINDALIDITIVSKDGVAITHSMSTHTDNKTYNLSEGEHEFEVTIDNFIQPGFYSITAGVHYSDGKTIDYLENIYDFSVLKVSELNQDYQYAWVNGFVHLDSKWIKIK